MGTQYDPTSLHALLSAADADFRVDPAYAVAVAKAARVISRKRQSREQPLTDQAVIV